jgi:hypothetical protein
MLVLVFSILSDKLGRILVVWVTYAFRFFSALGLVHWVSVLGWGFLFNTLDGSNLTLSESDP